MDAICMDICKLKYPTNFPPYYQERILKNDVDILKKSMNYATCQIILRISYKDNIRAESETTMK